MIPGRRFVQYRLQLLPERVRLVPHIILTASTSVHFPNRQYLHAQTISVSIDGFNTHTVLFNTHTSFI